MVSGTLEEIDALKKFIVESNKPFSINWAYDIMKHRWDDATRERIKQVLIDLGLWEVEQ